MRWLDVEVNDAYGHDNDWPTRQGLGLVSIDLVLIFFGFKRVPNTKAVEAVHFDLAEIQRDAHGDQYESEANESDRGLYVDTFHVVLLYRIDQNGAT